MMAMDWKIDQKRNRLVSFRLTEEEYQTLQHSRLNGGARSVSDFARRTLCHLWEDAGPMERRGVSQENGPDVGKTLQQLVETMEELNRVMNSLSVLIQRNSKGSVESNTLDSSCQV